VTANTSVQVAESNSVDTDVFANDDSGGQQVSGTWGTSGTRLPDISTTALSVTFQNIMNGPPTPDTDDYFCESSSVNPAPNWSLAPVPDFPTQCFLDPFKPQYSFFSRSISSNTNYDFRFAIDDGSANPNNAIYIELGVRINALPPATITVNESPVTGGTWTVTPVPRSGSPITVRPAPGGTNYTITVNSTPAGQSVSSISNSYGSGSSMIVFPGETRQFTINYVSDPTDPDADIKANDSNGPVSVLSGQPVTLSWTCANSTSATASNNQGNVNWQGSKTPVASGSQSSGAVNTSTRFTLDCSDGSQTNSDFVDVNVTFPPPTLTATTGASCGQINLSWTSVSGATGYKVYRSTSSGGVYSLITPIPVTSLSYTDGGLTAGATYWYKVRATNGSTDSADSTAKSAAANSNCVSVPPPPTGLTATPGACGTGQITLSWSSSSGATSYQLYRGGAQIYSGSATNHTDTGLTAGQSYSYTVRATNSSGSSAQSSPAVNTTAPSACSLPTVNLSVSPASISSGQSSTISWTSTNAASCSASSNPSNSQWTGGKTPVASGNQTITNITATTAFTLNCTGAGGSASDSKTVTVSAGHTVNLNYSLSANRSSPQTLNGATLPINTNVYIFTDVVPNTDVTSVVFNLNGGSSNNCNDGISNPCSHTETGAPYDFAQTTGGNGVPYQFTSSGGHTIVSTSNYTSGSPDVITADFNVSAPSTATINVVESGASGGTWTINPGGYTGSSNTVNPSAGGTSYTITVNSTPAGYSVSSISNSDGSGSSMTVFPGNIKQFTINYSPVASFDYSMSAPNPPAVFPGGSTPTTVTKTLTSGTSQQVFLNTLGLPGGITPNYDANRDCSPSCNSTLTFNVGSGVSPGSYGVTLEGSASGGPTRSVPVTITVSTPPSLSVSCSASPTPGYVGQQVIWTASVSGGTAPYTYEWAFDGGAFSAPQSSNTFSKTYQTTGQKTADVIATDDNSFTTQCSTSTGLGTVQIVVDPEFKEF
jgi:hypothetical protein